MQVKISFGGSLQILGAPSHHDFTLKRLWQRIMHVCYAMKCLVASK